MRAILIFLAVALAGCSDAEQQKYTNYGKPQHIKQFSGGVLIGEWDSTGKVSAEAGDGYYFKDASTGKIIEISGDVQITLK